MIYPHRIAFQDRGKCDICDKQGKIVINTNTNHFFGWTSCGNENCNETIQKYYDNTTITLENLHKKYGKYIKIKRSNGTTEYGWVIISDAHKEEEDGPYWLKVRELKNHLTKEVTIAHIEEVNN